MSHIACNPFVFRQTPESKFSHFQPAGSAINGWTVLEQLVELFASEKEQVVSLIKSDLGQVDAAIPEHQPGVAELVIGDPERPMALVWIGMLGPKLPTLVEVGVGIDHRHVEASSVARRCRIYPDLPGHHGLAGTPAQGSAIVTCGGTRCGTTWPARG